MTTILLNVPVPVTPIPPTAVEHPDVIWYIALLALGGLLFFVGRTLNKIDKNQSELFSRVRENETEVASLKGEHKTMCSLLLPILQSIDKKLGGAKLW
jgi:hypothetical protein